MRGLQGTFPRWKKRLPSDHFQRRLVIEACEHIPTWISLSGDLAFSHQDGIYGFKFPKRFSELSQAKTSLYSLYSLYLLY
jgi:hypothetical protein